MSCGSLLKLVATASASPGPEAEQGVGIQANRALRNARKMCLLQCRCVRCMRVDKPVVV